MGGVCYNASVDDDRHMLTHVIEGKNVPGIQTWDQEKGSDNAVARLYNAHSMPRWFLIDGKGMIRARDPFGDQLIPS